MVSQKHNIKRIPLILLSILLNCVFVNADTAFSATTHNLKNLPAIHMLLFGTQNNRNGSTDFPFGIYGTMAERARFSPQIYIESTMSSEYIEHVFQEAEQGGYKVYQYISADVLYHPLEEIRDDWILPATNFGNKHGNTLAGFYLPEELGVDAVPRLKALRNLIHEMAPEVPAITYLGYYENWLFENNPDLGRAVDANIMGTYPINKNQSIGLMTGVMELGRKYNHSVGSKIYGTPSTWDAILELPDTSLRVRSMLMQALIGGAEGVMFFNGTGFVESEYPDLNLDLDRMQNEFTGEGGLADVLMQPDAAQVVTPSIVSGPTSQILFDNYFTTIRSFDRLQTRLKVKGNDLFLFAANIGGYDEDNSTGAFNGDRTPDTNPATNGTLTVQFSNLPSSAANVLALAESDSTDSVGNRLRTPVGINRSIALHDGIFTDTFGPYETHVYKFTGNLPSGFVLDVDDPTVYMSNYINNANVTITGTVYPPSAVTVNGVQATVTGNSYSADIAMTEGDNQTIIVDSAHLPSRIVRNVHVDFTEPNTINLQKPSTGDVFPIYFTWEGSDNLAGADLYSYRIDGGDWSIWQASPYKYFNRDQWIEAGYSFATHTLEVRTRDRAFNIESTPAQLTFTASANEPPGKPAIGGATTGLVGNSYAITVNSTDPDGDNVSFNVIWDDGTESGWTNYTPSGQDLEISHQFNFGGEHMVRVLVKDSAGNVTRWTDSTFRTIGIKGTPTRPFPYGFYGAEPQQARNQYSPRVYIDSAMQTDDIDVIILDAADHGLQVYQYLSQSVVPLAYHALKEQWIEPAMAKGDETGALAGYYPAEEFSLNAIPRYINLMNTIHATDSSHRPVITYIGAYSSWEFDENPDLVNTVDINIMGAYPVYKGQSMALMTGIMALGRQYFEPAGKKVYAAAETYGSALTLPDARLRIRNTTYQAVIGGATGFINYNAEGYDEDAYPALNQEYDMLAEEFVGSGRLGEVILQPDPEQTVTATITDGPTSKILFENYFTNIESFDRVQTHMELFDDNLYLFVVNIGGYDEDNNSGKFTGNRTPDTNPATNGTLTVQFSNLPTSATSLAALSESDSLDSVGNRIRAGIGINRTIPVNNGTFTDTLGPYEMHVYRVPLD